MTYKDKVVHWLESNLDFKAVEKESVFTDAFIESHVYNIFHSSDFKMGGSLRKDNLYDCIMFEKENTIKDNIFVYKIVKNDKSERYFKEVVDEDLLFVLVYDDPNQETVDYVASNSNRLFMKIVLDIGISDADIRDKTEKYLSYMSFKEFYSEDYGDE
ncbi:hypothetical protein OL233_01590 [Vagococcus sp. PNs007]|uniref:DUF4265 domain-containing protein n=1 Tax=Vagococcus proximus TaxID=2991417 RepID=A0ABT5WYY9_9ENTE|nr:hypothetical protein [Vagococcus proximus]MDF0478966.1 hypothetical protein [Vagococcus proximus]